MGKASMQSCSAGAALVIYEWGDTRLVKLIAKLESDQAALLAQRDTLDADIAGVMSTVEQATDLLDVGVHDYVACVAAHPEDHAKACKPISDSIAKAQASLAEYSARLAGMKRQRDTLETKIDGLEAHLIDLYRVKNKPGAMTVPVADYTMADESAAPGDDVGTIEVWGCEVWTEGVLMPTRNIIVRPQFFPDLRAYKATRDYIVAGSATVEPAMHAIHIAHWAWLQEHRPQYVVAVVSALDHQAQTLTVQRVAPEGLAEIPGVDYAWSATLGVLYRDCGTWAFRVGDRVVVEFQGYEKQGGFVIGFERDPRTCDLAGWVLQGGAGIIRQDGVWQSYGSAGSGNCSWYNRVGKVVTWFGSPLRYFGTAVDDYRVWYRGASTSIPAGYGYVRGAALRRDPATGHEILLAITVDVTNRRDCYWTRDYTAAGSWTLRVTMGWQSFENSSYPTALGTATHVVAFNDSATEASVVRLSTVGIVGNAYPLQVVVTFSLTLTGATRSAALDQTKSAERRVVSPSEGWESLHNTYTALAAVDYRRDELLHLYLVDDQTREVTTGVGATTSSTRSLQVEGVPISAGADLYQWSYDGSGDSIVYSKTVLYLGALDLRILTPLTAWQTEQRTGSPAPGQPGYFNENLLTHTEVLGAPAVESTTSALLQQVVSGPTVGPNEESIYHELDFSLNVMLSSGGWSQLFDRPANGITGPNDAYGASITHSDGTTVIEYLSDPPVSTAKTLAGVTTLAQLGVF